jgi:transposase-like protein
MEFMREFSDDEACLVYLWRSNLSKDGEHAHCPKCNKRREFSRYGTKQQRQSWTCTACGHHLHPTAGTIFHKSSTSLHLWFYAIYLMTSTRCGISAKQLERELGVTYKAAWRMFHEIRSLLSEDVTNLGGAVEVDEMYVGGKRRMRYGESKSDVAKHRLDSKVRVLGMVERGGRVRASAIGPDPLMPNIVEHVLPATMVYTDEYMIYKPLARKGFRHERVNHSAKVWVSGDAHTITIEGFWSLVKRGISGVYHSVSAKHLQSYLDEYSWRYNRRHDPREMVRQVLERAAQPSRA